MHFCVVDNLDSQTFESKSQYIQALEGLNSTYFLSYRIYSRVHSLFLFLVTIFPIQIVIGNIIGFYCRSYFEISRNLRKPIVVVDDGLVSVSIAKLVARMELHDAFIFATNYGRFMPESIAKIQLEQSFTQRGNQSFKIDYKTLGVMGSPMVESGFLDLVTLQEAIFSTARQLGCSNVHYFMHRRELKKFNSASILEIVSGTQDSLMLISSREVIPKYWWSVFSSALVDLAILEIESLEFFFKPLGNFHAMKNSFLAEFGVDTVGTIYEIYRQLGFTEVSFGIDDHV